MVVNFKPFLMKVFKKSFAGSWIFRVPHSIYAEDSPKCIRTLLLKSCGEDDIRDRVFRCSTGDAHQSVWCLSAVFHCSGRILNDVINELNYLSAPSLLWLQASRCSIRHARGGDHDMCQEWSHNTARLLMVL